MGYHQAENNPNWKGGNRIQGGGYRKVWCKGHHRADANNLVYEHILIMEKHLGRQIMMPEVIHHINGNKQDNRLENLQLFNASQHMSLERKGKPLSEEHKQKIGLAGKFKIPWNKGKPMSEQTRQKISLGLKNAYSTGTKKIMKGNTYAKKKIR